VLVITTRFPVAGLGLRKHAHSIALAELDVASARGLLASLGVRGSDADLDAAARWCGFHAKAVELLATYLTRFEQGEAHRFQKLPDPAAAEGYSDEELRVWRVLAAFQAALPPEAQDILALTTAFREPPAEAHLLEYLASEPVHTLRQQHWGRAHARFSERSAGWLAQQLQQLVDLRLLERVGRSGTTTPAGDVPPVIDAHPLVRRGFEHVLGQSGRKQGARARAGFLRGRPDRRRPDSLEDCRQEIELFHAYCDAHLWSEADGVYIALENPKHRFLAPAFERDLLLRFFPDGDWRRTPLWPGFGRYRSLAICFELLGHFDEALAAYCAADQPLRGDALLALGRLQPLLEQTQAPHPWQALWQAYRAHAICLAGQTEAALSLARTLVPVDVYEWVHVFECLLRTGQLRALDLGSMLFRPPLSVEHRWAALARQRMRADYLRLTVGEEESAMLGTEYATIMEAYDRGGLPYERALVRLSFARWLLSRVQTADAAAISSTALDLARRHQMRIVAVDALEIEADIARHLGNEAKRQAALAEINRLRSEGGYHGPWRP
jgi:hypothetical protein